MKTVSWENCPSLLVLHVNAACYLKFFTEWLVFAA